MLDLEGSCYLSGGVYSVAEEAAKLTPAEAVVGVLAMRVVGDHAVVSGLSGRVRGNDWADISTTFAGGHALGSTRLHLAHSLLRATHVGGMALVLFLLGGSTTDECKESLTLLGSGRLI